MGSINLNVYQRSEPQVTIDDQVPRFAPTATYRYKDIDFDLGLGGHGGHQPANKPEPTTDLKDLRDLEDIKQSMLNIFNTVPGQKVLNPYLGLNLSRYVFDTITAQTADMIARTILVGLPEQEPRIKISELSVIGNVPRAEYNVSFTLNIPGVNIQGKLFKGDLTSDGFTFGFG